MKQDAMSLESQQIPINICNRNSTNQYLDNINLSLKPNPIQIKSGKTISIDADLDLLKEIPKGSILALKLKKHELIDLTIPCLHVSEISI